MSDSRILAAEVGAKAELRDVALRSLTVELEPPPRGQSLQLSISWETAFERGSDDDVEYRYRLAVGATPGDNFFVRAEFSLAYSIEGAPNLTDNQLRAFGEVSVAFSAFPYGRELIQSLTTRASLPPLVLGTLRAPIDPPAEKGMKARAGSSAKKRTSKSTATTRAPKKPRPSRAATDGTR